MFSLLYDLCLVILCLLALPKLLWQRIRFGKYRQSLLQRLGFNLPVLKKTSPVIWIHAVSLGETKAATPLFNLLKEAHPEAQIVISTTTETGHKEAKASMPSASAHFFLPFDFSFLMRRVMRKLHPNVLILVESDLWYHLLKYAKAQGAQTFLVNGKMSERSFKRYRCASFFSRRLLSLFDVVCLQNERFRQYFHELGVHSSQLFVTGNLKYDTEPPLLSPQQKQALKTKLGIKENDRVLVIGSTHAPEEEWLLSAISSAWDEFPNLKVLLVPRHPERFASLAKKLQTACYSQKEPITDAIILIDAMGLLTSCYQIADLAIVGGSFIPSVGGHNIMEPAHYGVPVFFGMHMHTQTDMVEEILKAHAGKQLSLQALPSTLLQFLRDPALRKEMGDAGIQLTQSMKGAAKRTFKIIPIAFK